VFSEVEELKIMSAIAFAPSVLSRPATLPTAASAVGGGGHGVGHGQGHAGGGGGIGGFLSGVIHRIFSPKTLVFAGLGAAAAACIPPLAFLGGPIGGAIAGAVLAQII
jgi:hypothetical protein